MTILTGDDETARLWNAATGSPVGKPLEHEGAVNSVAFSPDGKTVLTAGGNRTARLWDAATGRPIGKPLIHQSVIDAASYSTDGKTICMRSEDGTAGLMDAFTGQPVGPPFVPASGATPVSYSPDCKNILAWRGDKSAQLWDAPTGLPVGPLLEQDGVNPMRRDSLAFSPDGRSIVVASGYNRLKSGPSTARLWHLPDLVDEDLPRMKTSVETMTGMAVDDEGNVNTLRTEAWRECRARLSELGGPPQTDSRWLLDPILHGSDPAARVRGWIARKCWVEAETAFAEVLRARPLPAKVALDFVQRLALRDRAPKFLSEIVTNDPLFDRILSLIPAQSSGLAAERLATRAELLAKQNQWARANADFWDVARLRPLDTSTAFHQILTLQAAGNHDRVRSVASSLLERMGKSRDSSTANNLAWCLVLASSEFADSKILVRLAQIALEDIGAARTVGPVNPTTSYPFDRFPRKTKLIIEKLEQPIPMHFPDATSLEDVLKYIRRVTATPTDAGIPIYVDPIGLQEAEKLMTSPVKIDLKQVLLKTALRLILKQLGLTHTVKDGFLIVTSEESSDQQIEVRGDAVGDPALIPLSSDGDGALTDEDIGGIGGLGESGIPFIPALGAALYRAGRIKDTIGWLERRIELSNGTDEPIDWPFMAMAHQRLGHHDEAVRWLERLRTREPSTNSDDFWNELAVDLLRSEAEAIVLYDPVFPADPFAH